MKTVLELKFVEFQSNDPKMKAELKALEKEGWQVEKISPARARKKKFRLKRLADEAV